MPAPPPPPPKPPRHPWIPIACGVGIGVWILSLLLGPFQRTGEPATRSPLPPVPLGEPLDPLDPLDATRLLVEAVIQVESQGDPDKVGAAGERGLMQIKQATWREVTARHYEEPLPFDRAFEPAVNREVGRLYLGDLQRFLYAHRDQWRSDLRSLLLAAYNAGPERVRAAGFDLRNLPASVQSYTRRASALHDWYLGEHATEMRETLIEAGSR